jgi:cytochrome c551
MRIKAWLLTTTVITMISLAACGASKDMPNQGNGKPSPAVSSAPSPETNPTYVKAAELFEKNKCISCHGVDLAGRVGPKTNLQKVGSIMTPEQITAQIRDGGGGMPAYQSQLTADEIHSLTDWLRSKK